MINKKSNNDSAASDTEYHDKSIKYTLSKFEYDLFNEEDDVAEPIIRVKRFSMPNNGEKWKVFADNKVVLIIEGSKLTNKEREFLRTVDGVNFLLKRFKEGIKSFSALKSDIKRNLTEVKK